MIVGTRSRRRRGFSLAEVVLAAGISTMVLIAGVGLFLTGMRSWISGEANMDVSANSQRSLRFVSDELREAMSITVNTPTKVTYVLPKRESDGTFTNPMVGDGITRTIQLTGTNLVLTAGSVSRVVARSVLAREPSAASDYAIFTTPPGTVSRSLTLKLVASTPGVGGQAVVERSRETVFLRNVPQLSR
ncbi:hypothetical protein EON81_28345 [bacterium]|nr:MAG: hypothetical protein EON81_28345 [bacterium]